MPTFNEYKNERGYYIRAWTPGTGNINYKIRREGAPIVNNYDISDEDVISWDTIKSLKSLGLIYTEGSGTLSNDDFDPDPDQVEETSLSAEEAQKLLETIQEHRNLSQEKLEELCSILGIEPATPKLEQLEDMLEAGIRTCIDSKSFPTEKTLPQAGEEDIHVVVEAVDLRGEIENGYAGIEIYLLADSPTDELNWAAHRVFICKVHGIENWLAGGLRENTWTVKAEVCRQKGHLISLLAVLLDDVGIDPGSPTKSPTPEFRDLSDLEF